MTGDQLWTLFLTANVADEDLRSLGHDLYFARSAPRGDESHRAVNGLAAKLAMPAKYAYSAMNTDPGRKTLEQMGLDYEKKHSFATTAESTQRYINQIAHRIGIIRTAQKAKDGPPPGSPGSPVVPAHVAAQASRTSSGPGTKVARTKIKQAAPKPTEPSKPLWPVVLGVSVFVGVLSYFSRKGHALVHHRLAHN